MILRSAVSVFLRLYNPVKPFSVHATRRDCLLAASEALAQKRNPNTTASLTST